MSYGQYSAEHVESHRNPLKSVEAIQPKRRRNVFPTDEIPHLWAHKSQDSARNPGGNLFFRDETIYSYGEHFPIARHIENAKGQSAVLFTTGRYSVTTSRHISSVRGAIPNGAIVFEVPKLGREYYRQELNHAENIKHYTEQVSGKIRTAARARSSYSIEWNLREAKEQYEQCKAYCKFFGLKTPKLEKVPEADTQKLTEIRAKEREKAAKQAAKSKAEREAARQKQEENYAAWLRGEDVQTWQFNRLDFPTALRIEGDEVVTTMGARFPVSHAKKGLALVESVMQRGESWQRNGHTCHLGHYQIDRIEANGTVHAGCHVVSYAAIQRIREQLLST